jgi:hypothetical protein
MSLQSLVSPSNKSNLQLTKSGIFKTLNDSKIQEEEIYKSFNNNEENFLKKRPPTLMDIE